MNIAVSIQTQAKAVRVTDEAIVAELVDGRTINVPLAWSWRLSDATPEQRARWEIIGDGQGFRCQPLMKTSALKACCTGFLRGGRGGSNRSSPDYPKSLVPFKLAITGEGRNVFGKRRGDQHPVKRITMMRGQSEQLQ